MRKLTLNEKISIKGILEKRGVTSIPKLNTKSAIHYWSFAVSPYVSIKYWSKYYAR